MFKGVLVALVTPFDREGRVEEPTLRSLVEFHLKQGTDGIVPCGSTGEAATLSVAEHKRVTRLTIEVANGRTPVVAGTGSNSTDEAIELTRDAKAAGATAALLITPYYNKPTQEGLFRHFEAVARAVDLPLVLYNVPSRTGVALAPETVARLSKLDQVVAIKEASGSLETVSQILSSCGITVLSGDDVLTLPMLAVGATGVISVVANLVPQDLKQMIRAVDAGDLAAARAWHYRLLPLAKVLFCETNPIPVKAALEVLGMAGGTLRLPLCPLSAEHRRELERVLAAYGLQRVAVRV